MKHQGRHRRQRGTMFSTFQIIIMILFGSLGVLAVITSLLLARPAGTHRRTA